MPWAPAATHQCQWSLICLHPTPQPRVRRDIGMAVASNISKLFCHIMSYLCHIMSFLGHILPVSSWLYKLLNFEFHWTCLLGFYHCTRAPIIHSRTHIMFILSLCWPCDLSRLALVSADSIGSLLLIIPVLKSEATIELYDQAKWCIVINHDQSTIHAYDCNRALKASCMYSLPLRFPGAKNSPKRSSQELQRIFPAVKCIPCHDAAKKFQVGRAMLGRNIVVCVCNIWTDVKFPHF